MQSLDRDAEFDTDERRRESRRGVLVRADVQIPGKPLLSGHAVDVSPGGMGLQCSVAVEVGEELVIKAPFTVCGKQRVIEIIGKVSNCTKQTDKHFRLGLRFVRMDAETAALIATLCS